MPLAPVGVRPTPAPTIAEPTVSSAAPPPRTATPVPPRAWTPPAEHERPPSGPATLGSLLTGVGGHRAAAAAVLGATAVGAVVGAPTTAWADSPSPVTESDAEVRALAARLLDAMPFESSWATAADGSIGAADVAKALGELGSGVTPQKLVDVLGRQEKKLSADGAFALRSEVMARSLAEAASDGTISLTDLQSTETALGLSFGSEAARRALVAAFPLSVNKLDPDAAKYLLERVKDVSPHAARVQLIVDELLTGSQTTVDTNFNGRFDASDVVFTKNPNGDAVAVARVGEKMQDQVRVSEAVISAAHKLNNSGISFALIAKHYANSDYWKVGSGGVLSPKPGVKPSDAVADLANNGSKYGFECATGLVATYYVAALDLLGPEDFDRIAGDLQIGPWVMEDDLRDHWRPTSPRAGGSWTELGDHPLTPGNYYYFRNWDVTDEARARGWQGENVVYLGGGEFYGHGIGLGDASKFVNKLAGEAAPSGRKPSLQNVESALGTDFLRLDHVPGK